MINKQATLYIYSGSIVDLPEYVKLIDRQNETHHDRYGIKIDTMLVVYPIDRLNDLLTFMQERDHIFHNWNPTEWERQPREQLSAEDVGYKSEKKDLSKEVDNVLNQLDKLAES